MELERLYFHESSVVGIQNAIDSVSFRLEDVEVEDGHVNGVLTMAGVKSIHEEGKIISSIVAQFDDGEVLDLKHAEGSIELLIEWNDFTHHISRIMHYTILCERVTFEVISSRSHQRD